MPQYDYRCQDCREPFSIERSMNDDTEPSCTHCGSGNATRIWNAFIMTSGQTQDVGQGVGHSDAPSKKSGCGSCSSHSCGTCH